MSRRILYRVAALALAALAVPGAIENGQSADSSSALVVVGLLALAGAIVAVGWNWR